MSHQVAIAHQDEITLDVTDDYIVIRQGDQKIYLHHSNADAFAKCIQDFHPTR